MSTEAAQETVDKPEPSEATKRQNWVSWLRRNSDDFLGRNRTSWLVAVVVFPVWALLPTGAFACACHEGSAMFNVYSVGAVLVWLRLLVGLILGETPKKIIIYFTLPVVFVIELLFIFSVWGHN